MGLGNVHGPIPSHGYLMGASEWKVVQAKADASGAWVTNKLDFYRYPKYMKQFPFAHTLTMTYRLSKGVLEVRTRIDNLGAEPMPVSIGFHPHFMLTDSVRNDWTLSIGGKTHWLLGPDKIPTGETEPSEKFLGGDIHAVPMSRFAAREIDEGFSDFERDAQGRGGITPARRQAVHHRDGGAEVSHHAGLFDGAGSQSRAAAARRSQPRRCRRRSAPDRRYRSAPPTPFPNRRRGASSPSSRWWPSPMR